jgi:hypothetical protein
MSQMVSGHPGQHKQHEDQFETSIRLLFETPHTENTSINIIVFIKLNSRKNIQQLILPFCMRAGHYCL